MHSTFLLKNITRLDSQESAQFNEICYLLAKLQVLLTDTHMLLSVIRSQNPEQVSELNAKH